MKPVVDAAGFAALSCNRCGACCTGMHLSFQPAQHVAEVRKPGRYFEGMTHDQSVADAEMVHEMLEPTGAVWPDGEPVYRCKHFTRDAKGLGVCTVYDHRPRMCSRFPYGRPAAFDGCSWNVRLVQRLLPVITTARRCSQREAI